MMFYVVFGCLLRVLREQPEYCRSLNAYAANKKLQIERKFMGAIERPGATWANEPSVSLGYIDSDW